MRVFETLGPMSFAYIDVHGRTICCQLSRGRPPAACEPVASTSRPAASTCSTVSVAPAVLKIPLYPLIVMVAIVTLPVSVMLLALVASNTTELVLVGTEAVLAPAVQYAQLPALDQAPGAVAAQ